MVYERKRAVTKSVFMISTKVKKLKMLKEKEPDLGSHIMRILTMKFKNILDYL